MEISFANNVALSVSNDAPGSLDAIIERDLQRFKAREEHRQDLSVGGEPAIAVDYRIENSGRAGQVTYTVHDRRTYRVAFELRNPSACGSVAPSILYRELLSSLTFVGR